MQIADIPQEKVDFVAKALEEEIRKADGVVKDWGKKLARTAIAASEAHDRIARAESKT